MPRYRCVIQYFGTRYLGFQRLTTNDVVESKFRHTVQEVIEVCNAIIVASFLTVLKECSSYTTTRNK